MSWLWASPACKYVSKEAEDIVGIRYQTTTGENIPNWEEWMCGVVKIRVNELVRVL
jgi:hypothetical protein